LCFAILWPYNAVSPPRARQKKVALDMARLSARVAASLAAQLAAPYRLGAQLAAISLFGGRRTAIPWSTHGSTAVIVGNPGCPGAVEDD